MQLNTTARTGMTLMYKQQGFTLVEVMVTVVIVGILAAIAVPIYTDYVVRGKIPDATSALLTKRVQNEQFFQDNRSYVGAPGCVADTTSSRYFTFSCNPAETATTYTLRADGVDSMAGFAFTLDEANNKATPSVASGWTASTTCWVSSKGGC